MSPIPITDFDFSIKIEKPTIPSLTPPKMPKGCFSLEIPVSKIMPLIRNGITQIQIDIKTQIEPVKDQIETQIKEKIPAKNEIINFIMSQGCQYEHHVTSYYNQLKGGLNSTYSVINGIKSKIEGTHKTIESLKGKITKVEDVLEGLKDPLSTLGTALSAAKIAINAFPPSTVGTPIPFKLFSSADDIIKQASSSICLMGGNIEGIPQTLSTQGLKLNEIIDLLNPFIGQLDDIIKKVQDLEITLEAYYLKWLAECKITNDKNTPTQDSPPPLQGNQSNYTIKSFKAITNNINQYPDTNPDDWYLSNTLNNSSIIDDNTPEWDSTDDYLIDDTVKIIIDSNVNEFANAVDSILNSGDIEYIEKIYNADFQMIGYRRYKA